MCLCASMCTHTCTHIHLHIHEVKFADCVVRVFYIYIGLFLYCYSVNCWQVAKISHYVSYLIPYKSLYFAFCILRPWYYIQIKNCYIFLVNWTSSQNTFCLKVCLVSYEYNYTNLLSIGVHSFFPFATFLYPYAIMCL